MPFGAIIGTVASAGIGAAAKIGAANKAAKASDAALQASIAQQNKVWDAVNPFMKGGVAAFNTLSDPTKVMPAFQASPDYQFRLQQGLNGVTTNRAVNGLLRSGSALKAVTGYASNLASGEFGNWWNRQSGLASQGLQGASIGAGVANSTQNAIQTNAANQGNAAIANGNAIGQFGGSIADLIGRYSGGGGSPGGTTSFVTPDNNPLAGYY